MVAAAPNTLVPAALRLARIALGVRYTLRPPPPQDRHLEAVYPRGRSSHKLQSSRRVPAWRQEGTHQQSPMGQTTHTHTDYGGPSNFTCTSHLVAE
eukprot:1922604-Pyramimonas_sp.AAC.1